MANIHNRIMRITLAVHVYSQNNISSSCVLAKTYKDVFSYEFARSLKLVISDQYSNVLWNATQSVGDNALYNISC